MLTTYPFQQITPLGAFLSVLSFYVNHQDFFQDTEMNSHVISQHLQRSVSISNGGAQVENESKHFSQNYCNLFSFPSLTCSQRWGLNERGLCV